MLEEKLQPAILKTLAFFDLFSFPLTSLEVWQHLYASEIATLEEIENELKKLPQIKEYQGFYFLVQRPNRMVEDRKEKYLIAEKKYRKVRRVAKILAILPFVRMIAVCNSLAYSNARAESDIDLFIISKAGKVWTTRFACLLILKIFGLRPKGEKRQDKFCLSFFVDENHLDLENIALARSDIYLFYWINQVYPVYDAGGYYNKFLVANVWVKNHLGNSIGVEANLRRVVKLVFLAKKIKAMKEWAWSGNWVENLLQKVQMKKLPKILKEKLNDKDVGTVIQPGVIKLISNDRREAYRNEWVIKSNELIKTI